MKTFATSIALLSAIALALAFATGCKSHGDPADGTGTYFGAQNAADPVPVKAPFLPTTPAVQPPVVPPQPTVAPSQLDLMQSIPTAPNPIIRQ